MRSFLVLRLRTTFTQTAAFLTTPDMVQEVYGVPVDILKHQGQILVVPKTVGF